MNLREGIIFAADSRTNAGIDHVSTFCKMHVFEVPDKRVIVMLSAGNLATSQSVVTLLREEARNTEIPNLYNAESMHHCAKLVGVAIKSVINEHQQGQQSAGSVNFNCNILLGGQIAGEEPRLFHVYPQGNFIESTIDTPYFQIGEIKYGKPIIDRIVNYDLGLNLAMKCALISFDSTIHSNVSVGMPIDFVSYRRDSLEIHKERLAEDNKYYNKLTQAWGLGIRSLFEDLP
jgi:putative proteasome-type protease